MHRIFIYSAFFFLLSVPLLQADDALELYEKREKGVMAVEGGFLQQAVRFFQDYREAARFKSPEFTDASILLIKTYLKLNDADAAKAVVREHDEYAEKLEDPYYIRNFAYWRSVLLAEVGKFEVAEKIALTLAEGEGVEIENRMPAMMLLAEIYVKTERWEKASDMLKEVVQLPGATEFGDRINIALLKTHIASGRVQLAGALLEQLRKEENDISEDLLTGLEVLLLIRSEKHVEALELYKTIREKCPVKPNEDWWLVASQLADALMNKELFKEAAPVINQAISCAVSSENRSNMFLKMVECQMQAGNRELAIQWLYDFKKEYPDSDEILNTQMKLAELLRQTSRVEQAAELYKEIGASELSPTGMRRSSWLAAGWCLNELRRFEDSVKAFDMAVKFSVNSNEAAEAFLLKGDACVNLENYTQAAEAYQSAADNYKGIPEAEKARFKQASARGEEGRYQLAAKIYQKYLEEYPEGNHAAKAELERGVALKNSGDYEPAAIVLRDFAEKHPQSPFIARALFEAHSAALGAGQLNVALSFLNKLVDEHDKSEFAARALYQRAYVFLQNGMIEKALLDFETFMRSFPNDQLIGDVYIMLGDLYSAEGKLEDAEGYYRALVTNLPQSVNAPTALYEAARCNYKRGEGGGSAAGYLNTLFRDYADVGEQILSKAHMLLGDIKAENQDFEEALDAFRQAAELVPQTAVAYAASGRHAEMLMTKAALATEVREQANLYSRAEQILTSLIENSSVPANIREMAHFRRGKIYEKTGIVQSAINNYIDILYDYEIDHRNGKIRDWFYFVKAGQAAAHLLLLQEEKEDRNRMANLHNAVSIYEMIAAKNVPVSAESARQAEAIRKAHGFAD